MLQIEVKLKFLFQFTYEFMNAGHISKEKICLKYVLCPKREINLF